MLTTQLKATPHLSCGISVRKRRIDLQTNADLMKHRHSVSVTVRL